MDTAVAKNFILENFKTVKSNQLNQLRKENEFCDLILKSEDMFEFKVHKVVVSSASNYFKDLLTNPREKFDKYIIKDINADDLEKIITFIYTNEFEEEFEDAEKFIKYALGFQIKELIEICLLILNKSINDHTCVKYWRLARDNQISSLEDNCLLYIVRRTDHLFENSLMSDLTIEEMRYLLADNRLHLQNDEKQIFEHVWKWAKGKVSEIKSFFKVFSEVVDLLHFCKLENEFIFQKLFGGHEDVLVNADMLSKNAKFTKQKSKDEIPSRVIFHKPTQRLFGLASKKMFIGLGEDSIIEKEINPRDYFSYTTFFNKFLICGGEIERNSITNTCEFFEPSTQEWKMFPSMKTKKMGHQCSYLDNKIYACGGFFSNTVEIFDLSKGEWDYGPEMLANNWNFGLTGINGALYAIGGQTDNVAILDPRTKKWNVGCSGFRGIHGLVRCVSIGSCIYCFNYEKRYIFDTRSNKFAEEISCKDFDLCFNLCELDGYIYCLGYQEFANTYSLNLIQYHLDGKQGYKKSYGLYNRKETTEFAIVSLYY